MAQIVDVVVTSHDTLPTGPTGISTLIAGTALLAGIAKVLKAPLLSRGGGGGGRRYDDVDFHFTLPLEWTQPRSVPHSIN